MPKGTKVARCVGKVKKQGKDKVAAIKICQSSTGQSYKTGEKSKKMDESTIPSDKQIIIGFINNILNKEYAKASENLQATIDEKIKNKISRIIHSK